MALLGKRTNKALIIKFVSFSVYVLLMFHFIESKNATISSAVEATL